MRKKLLAIVLCSITLFSTAIPVSASSLDDVVSSKVTEETQTTQQETQQTAQQTTQTQQSIDLTNHESDDYIESLKQATVIEESETANKINKYIKQFMSVIIQVIAYLAVIGLTLSVLCDLLYIIIPFLRKVLANGHIGTAQPDANQQGGNGFGGSSFGGGFGSSFGGGFGNSSFGGGFGNSGFGGGGFGNNQAQQQNPLNNIQLVSDAALNAVASEKSGGNAKKALSIYTKDMTTKLVITPILLVLALSGVLANLGFFLGDAIAGLLGNIISMV